MNKYSLFDELKSDIKNDMVQSVGMELRKYQKNDTIMQFDSSRSDVGIMESGLSYLVSINAAGEKSILDYYEVGNIFGNAFFPNKPVNLYYVIAKTKCTVYQCTYENIIHYCNDDCIEHTKLINELIVSSARRKQIHVDILSQRTIRNKLMTYFRYIAQDSENKHIIIPLTLSDLADYISVDRSAMMREIKKMNKDGLISSKGQKIILK